MAADAAAGAAPPAGMEAILAGMERLRAGITPEGALLAEKLQSGKLAEADLLRAMGASTLDSARSAAYQDVALALDGHSTAAAAAPPAAPPAAQPTASAPQDELGTSDASSTARVLAASHDVSDEAGEPTPGAADGTEPAEELLRGGEESEQTAAEEDEPLGSKRRSRRRRRGRRNRGKAGGHGEAEETEEVEEVAAAEEVEEEAEDRESGDKARRGDVTPRASASASAQSPRPPRPPSSPNPRAPAVASKHPPLAVAGGAKASKASKAPLHPLATPVQAAGRQTFAYALLTSATADWAESRRLGGGGFGSVYRATLPSGTPVAVKRLDETLDESASSRAFDAWHTELALLSQLVHPNVVPLLGASFDGDALCLVYQYCEGGALDQRLQQAIKGRPPLSARERLTVLSDVVRGLAHLHTSGLIHRDIKPANILLDGGGAGSAVARIGDFGIARSAPGEEGAAAHLAGGHGADRSRTFQGASVAGTLVYIAPEYLKGGACSTRVDAFAYGLVVLEVLTGKPAGSPTSVAPGGEVYESLLELWYEELLDAPNELMRMLDPLTGGGDSGAWAAHTTSVKTLHAVAQRCLEPIKKRRVEVAAIVPDLEAIREAVETTPDELRDEFCCPLSLEPMEDPVCAADGVTYERREIERWLEHHDVSPLTNAPLPHKFLSANLALKKLIAEAKQRSGAY